MKNQAGSLLFIIATWLAGCSPDLISALPPSPPSPVEEGFTRESAAPLNKRAFTAGSDSAGNLYLAGCLNDGLVGAGPLQLWLTQYSRSGSRSWGKIIEPNNSKSIILFCEVSVTTDIYNNVYVATNEIAPLLGEEASPWLLRVLKLDVSGKLLWDHTTASETLRESLRLVKIATDPKGNPYALAGIAAVGDIPSASPEYAILIYDAEDGTTEIRRIPKRRGEEAAQISINLDKITVVVTDLSNNSALLESMPRVGSELPKLTPLQNPKQNALIRAFLSEDGVFTFSNGPNHSFPIQKYDMDGSLLWETPSQSLSPLSTRSSPVFALDSRDNLHYIALEEASPSQILDLITLDSNGKQVSSQHITMAGILSPYAIVVDATPAVDIVGIVKGTLANGSDANQGTYFPAYRLFPQQKSSSYRRCQPKK